MGVQMHVLLGGCPDVQDGCIVEIGEGRGEGSSMFIEELCDSRGWKFCSVGVTPNPSSDIRHENYYAMTGEEFMANVYPTEINRPIVGAYMDNFDWTWEPQQFSGLAPDHYLRLQFDQYAARGVVLNNINSSVAHYRQMVMLEPYMVKNALVVFDDTWIDRKDECFVGKGSAAAYHLISKGWELRGPIPHHYISKGIRRDYGGLPHYIAMQKV
jgi:hypothetical protein